MIYNSFYVPEVWEKTPYGGERTTSLLGKLLKERIILLGTPTAYLIASRRFLVAAVHQGEEGIDQRELFVLVYIPAALFRRGFDEVFEVVQADLGVGDRLLLLSRE